MSCRGSTRWLWRDALPSSRAILRLGLATSRKRSALTADPGQLRAPGTFDREHGGVGSAEQAIGVADCDPSATGQRAAGDPDGNGVELYWDRPEEQWPRTPTGELAMGTEPLDLNELLRQ